MCVLGGQCVGGGGSVCVCWGGGSVWEGGGSVCVCVCGGGGSVWEGGGSVGCVHGLPLVGQVPYCSLDQGLQVDLYT